MLPATTLASKYLYDLEHGYGMIPLRTDDLHFSGSGEHMPITYAIRDHRINSCPRGSHVPFSTGNFAPLGEKSEFMGVLESNVPVSTHLG